MLNYYLVA